MSPKGNCNTNPYGGFYDYSHSNKVSLTMETMLKGSQRLFQLLILFSINANSHRNLYIYL